jgi:integrase
MVLSLADRLALGAIEVALQDARKAGDRRPALEVVGGSLVELRARGGIFPGRPAGLILRERDVWLRRLESEQRSKATVRAYGVAIDDLLAWGLRERRTKELFEKQAIVDYMTDYRGRCRPSPATYRRRFSLLRTFMVWLDHCHDISNPFRELQPPPKPRSRPSELTREDFAKMLAGAERPPRDVAGLAERDKLALTALMLTGMTDRELIAVRWADVSLDERCPALSIRRGKRSRHRRIPLSRQLAAHLRHRCECQEPALVDRVFCGLGGGPLGGNTLAGIIDRAACHAGVERPVTPENLRHTVARWLKQAGSEEWLIAEFEGKSIVHFAGVVDADLREAMQTLADHVLDGQPLNIEPAHWRLASR